MQNLVRQYEALALHVVNAGGHPEPLRCPVCGVQSLVRFNDIWDERDDNGDIKELIPFVFKVQCFCCSLNLLSEIQVTSVTTLNLPNYFE